jgi:hypothetical protein
MTHRKMDREEDQRGQESRAWFLPEETNLFNDKH